MEIKPFRTEVTSLVIQSRKRTTGRVRWYNHTLCYGFVREDGVDEDIFFHRSAIQVPGTRILRNGQRVCFERCISTKGIIGMNLVPIAEDVSALLEQKLANIPKE